VPNPGGQGARRTILITGASDGIGLALARRYDAAGERLVLLGRRPAGEADAALCARHPYVQADLAEPERAVALLEAALDAADVRRLDVLVHNAALGSFGPLEHERPERAALQLGVDLEAPIVLTHAMLPRLEAARGRLVFVSSVAAQLACPDFAVYAAAKRALEGFARALRVELGGSVSVLVAAPGATRTRIHVRSGAPEAEVARISRRWPSAEQVAARLARAIDGRARFRTLGVANKAGGWLGRHAPRTTDRLLGRVRPSDAPRTPLAPRGAPRRALVTGAADGIGRALAERLLADGVEVVGVDVDRERAATLPAVRWLDADLGDPRALEALTLRLAEERPFDLVVHNAGISCVGRFAASDLAAQRRVLAVNLRAPLLLTPALLAAGRLREGASLVFISSLSHQLGYPGAAVYAATKDGLASYARSARAALRPRGLHVLAVFPGPVRTAHARRYAPPGASEASRMAPERLAARILTAVRRRRATLVPSLGQRLVAATLGAWAPGLADRLMKRVILARLDAGSSGPRA
jgi:short-subunit dehydrogenase